MKVHEEKIRARLEILIYTTIQKDAELTSQVLAKAGFASRILQDTSEVSTAMMSAGALILSEETLSQSNLEALAKAIKLQPAWSDMPIIVVANGGSSSTGRSDRIEWINRHLQNVTLLEKPIRLATLITVVRTALSSRTKQLLLKEVLEDLERAKREAEQASQAKSSFLANMSHEIRTPLAAIIGFTTLMRDTMLPPEERLKFTEIVARNGDQLAGLINDILDLSKIEAGKLEIDSLPISLPNFLAEITSVLRPMVEQKGLHFKVEIQKHLPNVISSDSIRLRQILLNLVSNAVKFTKSGTVGFLVSSPASEGNQVSLAFEVTDTGIGISDAEKPLLFAPFSQADSSVTRRFGGTGLGLALSKRLAEAMGGDLQLLASQPGLGSRFQAVVSVQNLEATSNSNSKSFVQEKALSGIKILLVEDSPDNQLLMTKYLSSAGAAVTTAENGKQAVDLSVSAEFDLILMDIQMPVMDGLTATRELRSRQYSRPIVALTAHALRDERERSLSAGFNAHLTKPIRKEDLIEAVQSYVKRG